MSENCFYENEVNNIKYLLDKMSDVIGNDNILDKNKLMKLLEFIKKNEDYLVNDINVYTKLKAQLNNIRNYLNEIILFSMKQ